MHSVRFPRGGNRPPRPYRPCAGSRRRKLVSCYLIHAVFAAMLAMGAAPPVLTPFAQEPPPWVVGEVRIAGTGLTLSDSEIWVSVNVAAAIQTTYGGVDPPDTWEVRATMDGPGSGSVFGEPQTISVRPNEILRIPPLPVSGDYLLSGVRLMDGEVVITEATPDTVIIHAVQVLVTSVTARPMTWEEIQESGIVIDENDYQAVRFTVGFLLGSEEILLDFPVLFDAKDPTQPPIILEKLGVPGPPPLPDVLPPNASLPEICLKCLDLTPVQLEVPDPNSQSDSLNLSGLLIFPSTITYLNQFFAVGFLLENGAPASSSLVLSDMTAVIKFPDDSQFTVEGTTPEANPDGSVPVFGLEVPPACDISPGETGECEFIASTPDPGTYTIDILIQGTLSGMGSGDPQPISGEATGVIIVRNPEFHITFTHPSVVRAGQEYTLKITVANSSETAMANDLTLRLPQSELYGAGYPEGETDWRHFESLAPGDSETVEFRLESYRTGQVRATALSHDPGVSGEIVLAAGVGEAGIPLSPDTLVLPEIVSEVFPGELVDGALNFLGLGWSLATAPPNTRPEELTPFTKGEVSERARELTTLARYVEFSNHTGLYGLEDALAELSLVWLGNLRRDEGFDALRRLDPDPDLDPEEQYVSKGRALAETLGGLLLPETMSILEGHDAFANATRVLNPHLSVAVDPSGASAPPMVRLEDAEGRVTGETPEGIIRGIPYSESYPCGDGSLLAVGVLQGEDAAPAPLAFHLQGTDTGTADLSVLAALSGGVTLIQYEEVPVGASSHATFVYTPGDAEISLLNDPTGAGVYSAVPPAREEIIPLPPLAVSGAAQDLTGDQTGRAAAVVFNRQVDALSSEVQGNYALSHREVTGAFLQADERTVLVRARSRISPLVANTIDITGVLPRGSQDPADACSISDVPILAGLDPDGGTVHGIIHGEGGLPLNGADVYLYEYDEDLLQQWDDPWGNPPHQHVTHTAVSGVGEDGAYAFDFVMRTGRTFRIEAVDPPTEGVARIHGIISASGQDLEIDLFMRARGTLKGTITGSDGSSPASGVLVTATESATGEFVQTFSDAEGYYRLDRVPVGTISILAEAPYGQGQANATAFLPSAGATVRTDLSLLSVPPGGIEGHVLTAQGDPATGAIVRVSGDFIGSVYAEEDGHFLMTWLPPGQYGLTVYDAETLVEGFSLPVTVTGGQVLQMGTLVLTEATQGTGSVSGTVFGSGGSPMAGVLVTLGAAGGILDQAATGPDGAYAFPDVPLGRWTVTALDEPSGRSVSATALLEWPGQSTGVPLYLPALGTVSGSVFVIDASGVPGTPPALVRVYLGGPGGQMVQTDNTGGFQFTDVPAGTHSLLAVLGDDPPIDYGSTLVRIESDGQAVTGADITMAGRGDLALRTEVAGTGDGVASSYTVIGWEIDPVSLDLRNVEMTGQTGADGNAVLEDLLAGTVRVSACNELHGGGSAAALIRGGASSAATVVLSPTCFVSGTVIAPDGVTPVGGATVTLVSQGLPGVVGASDPADGTFAFDLVPQGILTLSAEDPVSGRRGETRGVVTAFHDDPATPLVLDIVLLGVGDLQGIVYGKDGGEWAAVPNASVTLRKGVEAVGGATTDLKGFFAMNGIEEGDYVLEAVDPAHQFPPAARMEVTVVRDSVTDVSVHLALHGTVTGTLYQPDWTTPIANAQVTLSLSNPKRQIGFATTNTAGEFVFETVPLEKSFDLDAHDSRTGRSASETGSLPTPDPFVEPTLNVPMKVNAVGAFGGAVSHASALPVATPEVSASIPGLGLLKTTGGSDGTYLLPGIPEGTYTVTGLDPATGASGRAEGTIPDIDPPEPVTVDIALPPVGAVEGIVYDAQGQAVEGAVVRMGGLQPRATDAAGFYRFEGVAMGTYALRASAPAGRDGAEAAVSLDGPLAQADLHFIGTAPVYGAVVDPFGGSVEGFRVSLANANSLGFDRAGPVSVDVTGAFSFPDQRLGGTVAVTAVPPAASPDPRQGTRSGPFTEPLASGFDVILADAGSVSGTVVDTQGDPVFGAAVTLTKAEPDTALTAGTSSEGYFFFPVVPIENGNGDFVLHVVGPAGGGTLGSGTVAAGQALNVGEIVLDTDAPDVTQIDPSDGETGVPGSLQLTAVFDQPLDPATVSAASVKLTDAVTGLYRTLDVSLSGDGTAVTAVPANLPLTSGGVYRFVLRGVIADPNGNRMGEDVSSTFTVADTVPPSVVQSAPLAGAAEVPPETSLWVEFDEAVAATGTVALSRDGVAVPGETYLVDVPVDGGSLEPRRVLFVPHGPLLTDSRYEWDVQAYEDLSGNAMAPWANPFITVDTLDPTAQILAPPDGGGAWARAVGLPVTFLSTDGGNYCGEVQAEIRVDSIVQYEASGADCDERSAPVDLPDTTAPVTVDLAVTDPVGHDAAASIQIDSLPWTESAETSYSTAGLSPSHLFATSRRAVVSHAQGAEVYGLDPAGNGPPDPPGSIPTASPILSSGLYGNVLAAIREDGRLEAHDIRDPSAPLYLGETDIPGCAGGCGSLHMAVNAAHAYVGGAAGTLHIIRLDDPSSPEPVGSLTFPDDIAGIQAEGSLLAVSFYDGGTLTLSLYGTGDPAAPVFLSGGYESFVTAGDLHGFLLAGDTIFLWGGAPQSHEMYAVDISDPQQPALSYTVGGIPPEVDWDLECGSYVLGVDAGAVQTINVAESFPAGRLPGSASLLNRCGRAIAAATSQGIRLLRPEISYGGTSLQITSPVDGAAVGSGTSIQVIVEANAGYDGPVDLTVDGEVVDTRLGAPYDFRAWIPSDAAGTVALEAALVDDGGTTVSSGVVSVVIAGSDVTPPEVTLTAPGPGSWIVGGDSLIEYAATDDTGVVALSLLVEDQPVSLTPAACSGDCAVMGAVSLPFGPGVGLELQAFDAAGNVGSSGVVETSLFCNVTEETGAVDGYAGARLIAAGDSRFALVGGTTRLYDRASPALPVAEVSADPARIAVHGDLAVAAVPGGGGFEPASSGSGGILILDGEDAAADGSLAAVAAGAIRLYDISDPTAPDLLAEIQPEAPLSGQALRVWLGGDLLLAYLEDMEEGFLAAYGIGDPSQPAYLADVEAYPEDGAFLGSHFVSDEGWALVVYDLSDGALLSLAGVVPDSGGVESFGALGDRLLVAGTYCPDPPVVYDLIDPAAPEALFAVREGGLLGACGWDAKAWTGTHSVRIRPDGTGGGELSTLDLAFGDGAPPSVSILVPTEGQVIDTTTRWWTVDCRITDELGVASATVLVNGTPVRSRTNGPWTFLLALDSDLVGEAFTLEVRAADLAGNEASAFRSASFGTEIVGISLDPSGTLTAAPGDTVYLTAEAVLEGGVDQVAFTADGAAVCTDTEAPYTCALVLDGWQDGDTVTVDAVATGSSGSMSTAGSGGTLTIDIVSSAPNAILESVALDAPAWEIHVSPDGTLAVLATDDGVKVVSTSDWNDVRFLGAGGYLGRLLPDGDRILFAFWDDGLGAEVFTLARISDGAVEGTCIHGVDVCSWNMSLAADGRTAAFVDWNLEVVLLDVETMQATACCGLTEIGVPAESEVPGVAFLPDAATLLVSVSDGGEGHAALLSLDLETLQWGAPIAVTAVDWPCVTPDGYAAWMALGGGEIEVVDLATGQASVLGALPGDFPYLGFHPGGTSCTGVDPIDGVVFDMALDPPAHIAGHDNFIPGVTGIDFEPGGCRSYAAAGEEQAVYTLWVADIDAWPPSVTATVPSEGGTADSAGPVVFYLSEPMDPATITAVSFSVTEDTGGTPVPGSVAAAHEGTVVTWAPASSMTSGSYTMTVDGPADASGNALPAAVLHFEVE